MSDATGTKVPATATRKDPPDGTTARSTTNGSVAVSTATSTAASGVATAASVAHASPPTVAAAAKSPEASPRKKRKTASDDKDSYFNDKLFDLLLFRSRNGHCRVPFRSTLGGWVAYVRREKLMKPENRKMLTPERIQVLDSIDFVWHVQTFDNEERWKNQYQQLVQFNAEHGHANAPQSTQLGKWVKTQRENYSNARKGTRKSGRPWISQERMDLLNEIGFQWNLHPPVVGWEARYQELLEYIQLKGDPHVPQDYKPNVPLGRWVMKQRSQYSLRRRGLKNQLNETRIQRLESIGFKWSFKKEEASP